MNVLCLNVVKTKTGNNKSIYETMTLTGPPETYVSRQAVSEAKVCCRSSVVY